MFVFKCSLVNSIFHLTIKDRQRLSCIDCQILSWPVDHRPFEPNISIKPFPKRISLSLSAGPFLRFLILFRRFVLFLQCANTVLDHGAIILRWDLIFMFKVALVSLLVVRNNMVAGHVILTVQKASDSALATHIVVGWVHAVWSFLGSIVVMVASKFVAEGAKVLSRLSIRVVLPIAVLGRVQIEFVAKSTFVSGETSLFNHCFRNRVAETLLSIRLLVHIFISTVISSHL